MAPPRGPYPLDEGVRGRAFITGSPSLLEEISEKVQKTSENDQCFSEPLISLSKEKQILERGLVSTRIPEPWDS